MHPSFQHALVELGFSCHDCTTFTTGDVLGGIEREDRDIRMSSGLRAVAFAFEAMCAILNKADALGASRMRLQHLAQGRDVAHLPVEVDRNDSPGLPRHALCS